EERKAAYTKLQEVVREDLPFLPMFQYATVRGHKSDVAGVVPNINVRIDSWDVATWYWNK
ncbi:MAG: ABC transporter substrate-binding protein, partial [Fulvimarina sp.]|nr:ABC transporter substrate-binding protein [Fulvimarina sp.]